jgi:PIN domain nuclease of toxin-antitoxin system
VNVLADTHVLLWWKGGVSRMSRTALRELERAPTVFASPVSFWEVSTLLRLGRISLDRDLLTWVRDLLAEGVELAPLSASAAAEAGMWSVDEFHGDPADRLIYATARDLGLPLVTRDERLHAFAATRGDVRVIW